MFTGDNISFSGASPMNLPTSQPSASKAVAKPDAPNPQVEEFVNLLNNMPMQQLASTFLMGNISNSKRQMELLAEQVDAATKYLKACNNLMAQMNAAQATLDPKDTTSAIPSSQTDPFITQMADLGFNSPVVTVDKKGHNTMTSQDINQNVTIISNGTSLINQRITQLNNEMSSTQNYMNKYLSYASQVITGNSSTISTLLRNM